MPGPRKTKTSTVDLPGRIGGEYLSPEEHVINRLHGVIEDLTAQNRSLRTQLSNMRLENDSIREKYTAVFDKYEKLVNRVLAQS